MSTHTMTHESNIQPAASSTETVKTSRYHLALVVIHWLMALLILGAVLLVQENEGGRERFEGSGGNFQGQGLFQQGNPPSQDFDADEAPRAFPQVGFPQEAGQSAFSSTGTHMILGISILVLLIIRLIVRWRTKHPE